MSGATGTSLRHHDALLVVDVQNDFLPEGALAVPQGDEVIPILNGWMRRFSDACLPVFATRDWHPPAHASFKEHGGPWPPHCVAGTPGADFPQDLALPPATVIVPKGRQKDDPGYSAFEGTGLAERLRAAEVRRLFVGGLAADYCVLHTVRDALANGFEVVLLAEATRAVNVHPGDGAAAIAEMRHLGAVVQTAESARDWEDQSA